MNIYFINLFRKTIYIIFIGLLLSIILSKESSSSEQIFTIQNLEISKKINGSFSRNQIIDDAFKKGYENLLQQILTSSDVLKIKSLKLDKIKYLIEDFKIKDEFLNDEKYEAKFIINFNKSKVVKFLEVNNIFYSSPKKISALFFPILIDEEKIFSFQENIFYRNWLKEKDDNELINYILPLEDIDDLSNITLSSTMLEDIDISGIAKKYNTDNYILSIIGKDQDKIKVFSKIKLEKIEKNLNLVYENVDFSKEDLILKIINKFKIELTDIWKDFNIINTSIKLSLNLVVFGNDVKKIKNFENVLKKIDDINSFSIKKFNLEKTVYQINYNTDPQKLKNNFKSFNLLIKKDTQGYWVLE